TDGRGGHFADRDLAAFDVRAVMRRLRTVRTVFRAAAGLDAQEHAPLHFVGGVMGAMRLLRAEDQLRQRQGVYLFNFVQRPVVSNQVLLVTGRVRGSYRRRANALSATIATAMATIIQLAARGASAGMNRCATTATMTMSTTAMMLTTIPSDRSPRSGSAAGAY